MAAAPHMTENETALLASLCRNGATVLEFGCGGSTRFFFEQGAAHVVSVDSDKNWLRAMEADPVTGHFLRKKCWTPIYADIGPVGPWGVPRLATPTPGWAAYHSAVWNALPFAFPDLVLISGRFRLACLCQTLIRAGSAAPTIVFHDFWNREHYHAALEFTDVAARIDTTAVLRKPPRMQWQRVCTTLHEHEEDWR